MRNHFPILLFLLFTHLIASSTGSSEPGQRCMFMNEKGEIKTADSLTQIPDGYRASARCFSSRAQNQYLAPPDQIPIKGAQVADTLSTDLGKITLRGTRSVESLFGRTPNRAVIEASQTVYRVLRQPGWPSAATKSTSEWKIVFLDENLPEAQIPYSLISNCHPGWMTPPANIYIVAQRVAEGCSGGTKLSSQDADAGVMMVLIHEFGHAVEYRLGTPGIDRSQSEGFATWFELHASGFSPLTRNSSARDLLEGMISRAAAGYTAGFAFNNTAQGYFTAASPFLAIQKARGIRGIAEVYEVLSREHLDFIGAVQKALGWKPSKLQDETRRLAE